MKQYFAYIRVSTIKQGEQGSSLQEQKAAVEAYAKRHGLRIVEWFEEQETAASQGRPLFNRMLKGLDRGKAAGIITHKIDRSARNLRDWARLGELADRGIELHFAHESIDLTSRGGRLSADILAVVAADYIRNLRDEVRKGFYGRLKQGLYPLKAPLGYLDQGGGKPKMIDPVAGPLVRSAFELYRTSLWSLDTLCAELHRRGLRNHRGGRVTMNGLSTMLNNPFYAGIIKLRTTNEVFQGVHEPLIDIGLFDQVQTVLQGRTPHRGMRKRYRYQRRIRCGACGYALIAERQKGRIYYRCHTRSCPRASIREDRIDAELAKSALTLRFTDAEWALAKADMEYLLKQRVHELPVEKSKIELQQKAVAGRLSRMTDAYIDGVIDKDTFLRRKEELIKELAVLRSRLNALSDSEAVARAEANRILELVRRLSCFADSASELDIDELLTDTTSNLSVSEKELVIAWQKPFDKLVTPQGITSCEPYRGKPRTFDLARTIIEHVERDAKQKAGNDNEASNTDDRLAA
ncbi:recombinase family protein [Enhydrobacter sp.]|jgi:DNA invertase Pin-like site-specific DNA recombinase|uniref:recombinase family protein n=1 Tax=Enhydrobacter sp. TaxID=1894999 RepID=UPI00260E53DF|nr:recombinase family protein [Enhydrobacter sp.]WIM10540.1 MAG: Site-specific recombinase [Enhydrobacter sp.]